MFHAYTDNKDAITARVIEIVKTFNPTWTEAIANLADRHAQEQADRLSTDRLASASKQWAGQGGSPWP